MPIFSNSCSLPLLCCAHRLPFHPHWAFSTKLPSKEKRPEGTSVRPTKGPLGPVAGQATAGTDQRGKQEEPGQWCGSCQQEPWVLEGCIWETICLWVPTGHGRARGVSWECGPGLSAPSALWLPLQTSLGAQGCLLSGWASSLWWHWVLCSDPFHVDSQFNSQNYFPHFSIPRNHTLLS